MTNVFEALVSAELRKQIAEEMDRLDKIILEDGLKDWEGYKARTGERRGFKRVLEMLDKIEQESMQPDEERERLLKLRG